jgi:hypothetical protein
VLLNSFKKGVIEMKKKITSLLLIMLFLSFFAVTEAFSITYYVDTTIGKDNPNNWGLSPKKPWKTIAFAVQQTCIIEICEEVVIKIAGGTYNETIIINIRAVSLEGTGAVNTPDATIINGGGQNAVTIDGVRGVVIKNVEVINGNNGIIVKNGGSAELSYCSVNDCTGNGFYITGSSNVILSGRISAEGNVGNGILVSESSSVIFEGLTLNTFHNKDGVLLSGASSLSLKSGKLQTDNNLERGLVAAGNSRIRTSEGTEVGTIYHGENGIAIIEGSNAEIFGKLQTQDNGTGIKIHSNSGLSLNKKAEVTINNEAIGILVSQSSSFGADLETDGKLDINLCGTGIRVDGGSTISFKGTEGGLFDIHDNHSTQISIFGNSSGYFDTGTKIFAENTNPSVGLSVGQGSQVEANEVDIYDNSTGLSVGSNSVVSAHDIRVKDNSDVGVRADGGSVFLEGEIINNGSVDVSLIFGARSSLEGNIGTISCDETVLYRGQHECP